MVCREQISHLLIELAQVILDHAQFLEGELQEPTVEGCSVRPALKASRSCSRVARLGL